MQRSNPPILMMKPSALLFSVLSICTLLIRCTEDEPALDITDVKFTDGAFQVTEGFTYNLDEMLEVVGADADQAEISFSSGDATIVSIDGKTLTAVGIGSTTITATEANSNLTASAEVNVIANTVAVTGITLDKSEANLKVGETFQLSATIAPEDATEQDITWSVVFPPEAKNTEGEPTDIATVSENGLVTAVAAGDVVITATTNDGGFTASVDISITPVPVTGITLSATSLSVDIGGTGSLTATVLPENATNKNITWALEEDEGSPETYATVDTGTGIVTGISECEACGLALYVETEDGEFNAGADVFIRYVPVESITLDPSSFTVDVDGTQQVVPTILPANASNKNVTWSLGLGSLVCDLNPNDYASVSETGLVTGISTFAGCGGINVIATGVNETEITATANFTVNPILATSIEIVDSDGFPFSEKTINLSTCAESFQLYINVLPNDASDMSVTWSISDETEWSVDPSSGLLTIPLSDADGTFRVNVMANDGSGVTDYVDVIDNGCS